MTVSYLMYLITQMLYLVETRTALSTFLAVFPLSQYLTLDLINNTYLGQTFEENSEYRNRIHRHLPDGH